MVHRRILLLGVVGLASGACSGGGAAQSPSSTTAPVVVTPAATTPSTAAPTTAAAVSSTAAGPSPTSRPPLPAVPVLVGSYATGSTTIEVSDADGVRQGAVAVDAPSAFLDAVPTAVPGRVVARRLDVDGNLAVLDLEGTPRAQTVELGALRDAELTFVGTPRAHAVIVVSDRPPVSRVRAWVDLRTLEVTDLGPELKLKSADTLTGARILGDGAVEYLVWNTTRQEGRALVQDPTSTDPPLHFDGDVVDVTADAWLTVQHVDPEVSPVAFVQLLDSDQDPVWGAQAVGVVGAAALDEGHVLIATTQSLVVADVVADTAASLDWYDPGTFGEVQGLAWVLDHTALLVVSDGGIVLVGQDGEPRTEWRGARLADPGVYRGPVRADCLVLVGDGDGPAARLIRLATEETLHEYTSVPTAVSADGCSTIGGDARTPGELVVHGTPVPLAPGELPLALDDDGTFAVVRTADGALVGRRLPSGVDVALPAGDRAFLAGR